MLRGVAASRDPAWLSRRKPRSQAPLLIYEAHILGAAFGALGSRPAGVYGFAKTGVEGRPGLRQDKLTRREISCKLH